MDRRKILYYLRQGLSRQKVAALSGTTTTTLRALIKRDPEIAAAEESASHLRAEAQRNRQATWPHPPEVAMRNRFLLRQQS